MLCKYLPDINSELYMYVSDDVERTFCGVAFPLQPIWDFTKGRKHFMSSFVLTSRDSRFKITVLLLYVDRRNCSVLERNL